MQTTSPSEEILCMLLVQKKLTRSECKSTFTLQTDDNDD